VSGGRAAGAFTWVTRKARIYVVVVGVAGAQFTGLYLRWAQNEREIARAARARSARGFVDSANEEDDEDNRYESPPILRVLCLHGAALAMLSRSHLEQPSSRRLRSCTVCQFSTNDQELLEQGTE